MELKEFISETIKQIADGLVAGNNHIKNSYGGSEGVQDGYKQINFDIGVTSSEEDKIDGGGKITIAQVINVGGSVEGVSKSSNSNRVQFDTFIHVKT